jgi:hypothetical protein
LTAVLNTAIITVLNYKRHTLLGISFTPLNITPARQGRLLLLHES